MNSLAKFSYYQDELQQFRDGSDVSLRRIQIDPIAGCNHDCPFCIYRFNRGSNDPDMNALFNESNILSMEKMEEIFDDCVELGVKAVEITGGGEPSLHPKFPEILQMLNERGLQIGLVTNGAWRDKHFDKIIEGLKQATWVRFSLDAATSETHIITHASRKGDFKKATDAIVGLVAHQTVDVGISFIVQKNNYMEICAASDLAEMLGVKYIRFGGVVFEGEKIDHIELGKIEHGNATNAIRMMQNKGHVPIINAFDTRANVDFERYKPGDTCYYSHLATVIGADAKVYVCCVWKYRPDGLIADLNGLRFKDVWLDNGLGGFYEGFDISEKCTRCFLKDKNDHLHSLVTAEHVNFV